MFFHPQNLVPQFYKKKWRELAFLNSGLTIKLIDETLAKTKDI